MTERNDKEQRNRRLRAVFAACKAHGIDDDMRRGLVRQLTGRESISGCTPGELATVLDHMNRSKHGYAGRARVTPAAARAPLLGKVDALLAELHRVTGQVHTLKYADAIVRRNGWAECVDFASPDALHKLVGALSRTLDARKKRMA